MGGPDLGKIPTFSRFFFGNVPKVSGKVDEMLDVLGVMMEGVVEVDKEVDDILMEKKWVKCSI